MKTGTVAISLSGHDKGALYIVTGRENNFVYVVDGKNRLLSKPKRKNKKHLKDTGAYVDLSAYNPLYDAHIKKKLKSLDKCIGSIICNK